jgi:hypothetical protein
MRVALFILIAVVTLGIVVVGIGGSILYHFKNDVVEITVQEKEVKRGAETSKYLIFTEQGEVFQNTDYLLSGKWNSSTLQGKLKVGETYTVKVKGMRVPFLSLYRNIMEIVE